MKRLLILALIALPGLLLMQGCGENPRDEQTNVRLGIKLDTVSRGGKSNTQAQAVDMKSKFPLYFRDYPEYLKGIDISSISIKLDSSATLIADSSVHFSRILITAQIDSSYGNFPEYTLATCDSVSLYQLVNKGIVCNIANAEAHGVIRSLPYHPKMIVRTSFIPAADTRIQFVHFGTVTLNLTLTVSDPRGWF